MPNTGTDKGKGKDSSKDKGTDKGKGKGKDKNKEKGDTRKGEGYGKSPHKNKNSYKSEPYIANQRVTSQHGLNLIDPRDRGDWYYNSLMGCRQYWSSMWDDWIRGTWEEERLI